VLDNCDYCSEAYNDGDEIVEEVTIWRSPPGKLGEIASETILGTSKWMHKKCAFLRLDEQRQKPGQLKLI
jgi:hypothetical protein